jgi:hypothetical protein
MDYSTIPANARANSSSSCALRIAWSVAVTDIEIHPTALPGLAWKAGLREPFAFFKAPRGAVPKCQNFFKIFLTLRREYVCLASLHSGFPIRTVVL